jgi:hypothetical protein
MRGNCPSETRNSKISDSQLTQNPHTLRSATTTTCVLRTMSAVQVPGILDDATDIKILLRPPAGGAAPFRGDAITAASLVQRETRVLRAFARVCVWCVCVCMCQACGRCCVLVLRVLCVCCVYFVCAALCVFVGTAAGRKAQMWKSVDGVGWAHHSPASNADGAEQPPVQAEQKGLHGEAV